MTIVPVNPSTIQKGIRQITEELSRERTLPQVKNSVIDQGFIKYVDSGSFVRVRVGLQDDGTYDVRTYDATGNLLKSLNVLTGGGGTVVDASTTVKGIVKMSVAPVIPTEPIVVGDNDPRVPTQSENDALVGTAGSPSNTNRFVTDQDARMTNARTPTAHGHPQSDITNLIADMAAKAALASPNFTGVPTAPTAAEGTNTTQLATMEAVQIATGNASSNRPVGRLKQATGQSVPHGAWTVMTFSATAMTDTDGMATTASRLTCVTPGNYVVHANMTFASSGVGRRAMRISHRNSAGTVQNYYGAVIHDAMTNQAEIATSSDVVMAAGDYLQVEIYQESGAALMTLVNSGVDCSSIPAFSAAWTGGTGAAWGNAGARAYNSANQSTDGTNWLTLALNSERFDLDGEHDTVTNNSRITCVTPGLYLIVGQVFWTGTTSALQSGTRILKNGVDVEGGTITIRPATGASQGEWHQVTTLVQMSAGDYVQLQAYSSLAYTVGGSSGVNHDRTELSAVRVGYQTNPERTERARAYRSDAAAVYPIATGTWTGIDFDTEGYDTASMVDLAAFAGRITTPTGGAFSVSAEAQLQANGSGIRFMRIVRYNSAVVVQETYGFIGWLASASINQPMATSAEIVANPGDFFQVQVWQNSGVSLNVDNFGNNTAASLAAHRTGD